MQNEYYLGRMRGKLFSKTRSSRPEVFCKKDVLRNFAKSTVKHLCQILFFDKVAGLRLATLFKKRLWYRFFPENCVKFLRTPFLQNQNTSGGCFFKNPLLTQKFGNHVVLNSMWLSFIATDDIYSYVVILLNNIEVTLRLIKRTYNERNSRFTLKLR